MLNDRVRETSTTTGTGTLTTLGASSGFITFLSAFGSAARCYYVIDFGSVWEIGIGTVTSGFLTRDTVLSNSSGTFVPLSLAAGTKQVYCDCPSKVISTDLFLSRLKSSDQLNPGTGITIDEDRTVHCKENLFVDTDASTVTFDMFVANLHQVTLGGNRTLALANVTIGQKFMVRLVQDGTGTRTVTWFTTIKWAAGTAPTLTTAINKADWFGFVCTGTNTYDGFILGQNY